MVAATTLSEYKEYIQEDEALARRFRCVTVPEPSIEETRRILYHLRPRLERNYSVRLLDEAIEMALDDVAALHAAPAPAGQGDRLARHRGGAGGDRSPLGGHDRRRRGGDFARGADSGRHGVPRRHRSLQGHRSADREARDRSEECGARRRQAAGAEQGTAQGRVRSARRRAVVPRTDRRRQDRAGEGGGASSCSATRRRWSASTCRSTRTVRSPSTS